MKKLIVVWIMAIVAAVMLPGCSIGEKSWATASSADGFKIKSLMDMQSSSPGAQVDAVGGCHAAAFQKSYKKGEIATTTMSYSVRRSLWDLFSGASASNISFCYISGSQEKPSDTIAIINGLSQLFKNMYIYNESIKNKEQNE